MILGEYLADYYSTEGHRGKGEDAYEKWKNHHKAFEQKKIEAETLESLKIFDEKNIKKFIDYFVQWTDLFRALNI